MNVVLIYTEQDYWALGMRSISAVLKERGICTRILLMPMEREEYSPGILGATAGLVADADIIGISSLSRGSMKALKLLRYLRRMNKMTVWGGIHPTLNPEMSVEHADVVCRGEGEGFMLDLVHRMANGQDWRDLPNAAWRNNGDTVLNPCRQPIANLDELPLPDFSFQNEYHLKKEKFVRIQSLSDSRYPILFNGSRGCAFDCTYCSNSKLKKLLASSRGYVRKMSISRLIEHAATLRQIFSKSKYFYFIEEDFFARKLSEIREFSANYPEVVGLPFECMASAAQITEKKLQLLINSGLWRIGMGIESGSDRTKKEIYNRPINNNLVLRVAQNISKYPRLVPFYFFIIANPYEEQDDLLQTFNLIKKLPTEFFVRIYNLIFLPGTLLYEKALNDNIITGWQDSGYEIDFLGGLNYKNHPWKRKNLYLNGLLYLMEGKSNAVRIGLLPRLLLNILIHPEFVNFNRHHTLLIRTLIRIKTILIKSRSLAVLIMKTMMSDYISVYHRRTFRKMKPGLS